METINGAEYVGLNVGSGPHYADGWCNTDILPAPRGTRDPDVIADIFNYFETFTKGSFKKAYIGHVLEHIPFDETIDAVVNIAYVVQPGSPIMVVGPCIERAIETKQPVSILDAIRHDPDRTSQHPWGHAWTPTEALTFEIMQASGLDRVEILPIDSVDEPEWPNPSTAKWQTAVIGYVPANPRF